MTSELMTHKDLMKRYRVSQGTIYNWLRAGKFPKGFHVGRVHRWKLSEIEAFETIKTQEGGA